MTTESTAIPLISQRTYGNGLLLAIVFFGGMTTLGVELTVSRLLAPYFGNNLFVWANVIGLTLLYLSVGYFLGGKLADHRPDDRLLAKLVGLAAFLVGVIPFAAKPILELSIQGISNTSLGVFWGSLFGVLVLMAIPITLLGFVSPFAIRLATGDVRQTGAIAGRVYAIGTVGSLLGAFLPVLLLIPNIGTRNTFMAFSIALIILSVLALRRVIYVLPLIIIIGLTVYTNVSTAPIKEATTGTLIHESESIYNFIQVQDTTMGMRRLILNNEERLATHSVYFPNEARQPLTGGPWDYFLLAPQFRAINNGSVSSMLMIGLGAGTVPKLYTETYGNEVAIDGVEIDPGIIDVGHKFFDMNEPNLQAYAEDGRLFLRRADTKYDVIGVDAYRPPYIPFQLTTVEFFQELSDQMSSDGVVALNAGGGPNRDFRLVAALSQTMRAVFPSVIVIKPADSGNNLIYGMKTPIDIDTVKQKLSTSPRPIINMLAKRDMIFENVVSAKGAFTDDLAPIEQVVHQMILSYTNTD